MEDSWENLDDGELWLPSDIFPLLDNNDTVSVSFPPPNNNIKFSTLNNPINTTEQDHIIQRFAAFSLHHPLAHTHTTTERFRPARRCNCTETSSLFEPKRRLEELCLGPPPVHPCNLYPPVQLQYQMQRLMEARSRVLQMEENRFIIHNLRRNNEDRFVGNRRFSQPFIGSGHGGTGVFLPRVPNTNNAAAATTHHARKRQGGRNRQDVQHIGQRYP